MKKDDMINQKDMLVKALKDSAKKGKGRAGKRNYINYLEGKRLTRQQSIKAKCYDCDGMGETGVCEIEHCPLLPYSPYKP